MLKGLEHNKSLKFYNLFSDSYCLEWLIWIYLMSKLESEILGNKQDTEFEILCFVNKARVLLFFCMCFTGLSFNRMLLFLLLILDDTPRKRSN